MPLGGQTKVSKLRAARMKAETQPEPEEPAVAAPTSVEDGDEPAAESGGDKEFLTSESLPSAGTKGETIKVCVRIRPLIRNDKDAGEINAWAWETQTLRQDKYPPSRQTIARRQSMKATDPEPTVRDFDPLLDAASGGTYVFDHLFNPDQTNDDIYKDVIGNVVSKAMQGYHGSVFTYGQTSSGKTFTMTGTAKSPVSPFACITSSHLQLMEVLLCRASSLKRYSMPLRTSTSTQTATS